MASRFKILISGSFVAFESFMGLFLLFLTEWGYFFVYGDGQMGINDLKLNNL